MSHGEFILTVQDEEYITEITRSSNTLLQHDHITNYSFHVKPFIMISREHILF